MFKYLLQIGDINWQSFSSNWMDMQLRDKKFIVTLMSMNQEPPALGAPPYFRMNSQTFSNVSTWQRRENKSLMVVLPGDAENLHFY